MWMRVHFTERLYASKPVSSLGPHCVHVCVCVCIAILQPPPFCSHESKRNHHSFTLHVTPCYPAPDVSIVHAEPMLGWVALVRAVIPQCSDVLKGLGWFLWLVNGVALSTAAHVASTWAWEQMTAPHAHHRPPGASQAEPHRSRATFEGNDGGCAARGE